MPTKERYSDLSVEQDTLNWVVVGYDSVEKKDKRLPVGYGELAEWMADRYFGGDKKAGNDLLGGFDWLDIKAELYKYFHYKME